MKTANTFKNYLKPIIYLLIISFATQSCSNNDDDNPTIADVTYVSNTIDATFFEGGSSLPTINWNGNTGTFTLIESYSDGIQGLTLNETTGELTWTRLLKEGIWIFDVEATNSAGTTIVEMTINNTLQGVFTGEHAYYSVNPTFFEIEFFKNGTVNTKFQFDSTRPDVLHLGTGTWTINNDNEILVNYTSNGYNHSTFGTLTQTSVAASYNATTYDENDAMNGFDEGTVSLSIDN